MGPAETTGIVVITVVVIQGLIGLIKFLINKSDKNKEQESLEKLERKLRSLDDKISDTLEEFDHIWRSNAGGSLFLSSAPLLDAED